jgi:hypothetical protein
MSVDGSTGEEGLGSAVTDGDDRVADAGAGLSPGTRTRSSARTKAHVPTLSTAASIATNARRRPRFAVLVVTDKG